MNFRRSLLISSQIRIDLPSHILQKDFAPRIIQASLKWPTITSFRGLQLWLGTPPEGKEVLIMYNPQSKSLEWGDIPLCLAPSPQLDIKSFSTPWMNLITDYPGELYRQSCLEGQVEIELPGILLSGIQVRLFNAVGEKSKEIEPKVVSRIKVNFELILDEAFAKRKLSPYQHLYFDEVIPDEMRIADIKTAIVDLGFKIQEDKSQPKLNKISHFIKAVRPEGPDTMDLFILIEGTPQEAERETQVKGGQKFRSNTQSGDLRVFVRGQMPENSQKLTREMNALQTALHERFERLRARR